MFIFVPVGILMVYVLDYFAYKKSIQVIMLSGFLLVMAAFGHTTYIRNKVFKNDLTLWSDNIEKAPNLHRPHHNLGKALLVAGFYNEAFLEMQNAVNAKGGVKIGLKYMTHYNMGVFYILQNEYDKALSQFFKSLDYRPDNPKALNAIAMIIYYKNDFTLSEKYIKKAIRLDPDNSIFRNNLDFILKKQKDEDSENEGEKYRQTK